MGRLEQLEKCRYLTGIVSSIGHALILCMSSPLPHLQTLLERRHGVQDELRSGVVILLGLGVEENGRQEVGKQELALACANLKIAKS